MKSIGFEGIACEDIIMHLAKFFELCGIEAAIEDNEGSYSYSEIPVVQNMNETCFNGLLLVNGANRSCDMTCLVTDVMPLNARRLAGRVGNGRGTDYDLVIVRDGCGMAKGGEYIMNLLKLRCAYVCLRENEKDLSVRCCLQEGMRYRLKDLSPGMRKGIVSAGCILLKIPENAGKKALGKEGKWGR